MKLFSRTIFIWILSLSLTGMPVAALSKDMVDLEPPGEQSGKELSILDEHPGTLPCHSKSDRVKAKMMQTAQHTAEVHNAVKSVSKDDDGCCCGTDCQCQHDASCQSVSHSSVSAILQSTLFISSPLNSQLAIESTVLYHGCDTASEIIPPIV